MPADYRMVLTDGFASVVWLVANLLLFLASVQLAERFFPDDQGASKVLSTSVIAIAILTVILLMLGATAILTGITMLVSVSAAAAGILLWTRSSSSEKRNEAGLPFTTPFWLLLTGLLCGHCLVNGLLKLPSDFDCLMYHLPLVDSWLQAGSLYAPDCSHWSSPGGSELLALWCCGPFSGDFLSPLNNLPVVVVWASATLQFCRLLGMTQRWPELTTLATLSVYTLLHETDDASNDLMVVAFFMATNVYVVRCLQARETRLALMTGLCLGLLAGVKFFALGYAGVSWLTLVAGLAVSAPGRLVFRVAVSTALLGLVTGGYWYLRNLLVTGLPLYPMGDPADLAYPDVWSTSLIGNSDARLWPLFFDAIWSTCGPVHWAATFLLPMTACGLIVLILSSRSTDAGAPGLFRFAAFAFLIGAAASLWITPYLVEDQPGSLNHMRWAYTPARYGMSFLTMVVVCLAFIINQVALRSGGMVRTTVFAIAVASLVWQITARLLSHTYEFSHIESVIAGVDLGIVFLMIRYALCFSGRRRVKIATGFATVGLLAVGTGFLASRWHAEYDKHFDRHFRTSAFTMLSQPSTFTSQILVLDYRPYPFFGSARQHRVVNPRRYQSEEWLQQIIDSVKPEIITSLKGRGYQVDRYKGAVELLTNQQHRFAPVVLSGPMIVSRSGPLAVQSSPASQSE